jgi:hypothetical protein
MEATPCVASVGSIRNRKQLFLTLSLFVLGILADDSDDALALNDFALVADRLDRCSNFHLNLSFSVNHCTFPALTVFCTQ